MKKRYRRPKVKDNQIIFQKGKVEGDIDMVIYYGCKIPREDRSLIIQYLGLKNFNYRGGECKSLVEELEDRGYDLDTLKFSIEKKD